jgi:hypothetical protein
MPAEETKVRATVTPEMDMPEMLMPETDNPGKITGRSEPHMPCGNAATKASKRQCRSTEPV